MDEGGVFFNGNLERLRYRAQLQTADGDCPSTFNVRTNVEFVRNAQADGHNDAGAHRCSSSLSLFSPNSKTRQTKVTAEVQNHQAKSQNPGKEKQKVSDTEPLITKKTRQSGNKHKEGLVYIDKRAEQQRDTGETHEGNDLRQERSKGRKQYKDTKQKEEWKLMFSVWCTHHNKSQCFVHLGLNQSQIISLFVFCKHKNHLLANSPGCICTGDIEMMCFISA